MSTYSTNLGLTLIGTGEQAGTWGSTTNTNLGTLLEQSISGYVQYACTGGTDTITIPDGADGTARNMYIEFTGTGGGTVQVPAKKKLYFIYNNTASAITVKVSGQTGVSVPAGKKMDLVNNGTDVVVATNYMASLSLGSALPVASGGTGLTSTPANGALDIGNGTGFTRTTLTAGSNISITNASGSITIASSNPGGTVTSVGGTGTVNGITLTGTVTSTGNLTLGGTLSNVSLTSQVTGTLPIANGGTGQTTQQAAINALAGATTSSQFLRGDGTNVGMSAIQIGDVPTLNQNTTGQAGSVANAVTFSSSGGAAAGSTFNGSVARTVDYSTVGAPSTTGTGASGTWSINVTGSAGSASTASAISDGAVSTSAKIVDGVVTPSKLSQPYTLSTAQNTTSGTYIDFTSIPSWVKRVTIMLNNVSTSGGSNLLIQIGAGSITATGYNGGMWYSGGGATNSTGFNLSASAAGDSRYGILTLQTLGSNLWVLSGTIYISGPGIPAIPGGSITLSNTLDRLRLTTVGGTDTFDAGSMNISYE